MRPPELALGSEARSLRRRRERSSTCTRVTEQAATEPRVGGVPTGGRLTLEQLLGGVWEGLHAGGTAGCPICDDGQMSCAAAGAPARCESCGTAIL